MVNIVSFKNGHVNSKDLSIKALLFMYAVKRLLIDIGLRDFSICMIKVISHQKKVLVFKVKVSGTGLPETVRSQSATATGLQKNSHNMVIHRFIRYFFARLICKNKIRINFSLEKMIIKAFKDFFSPLKNQGMDIASLTYKFK